MNEVSNTVSFLHDEGYDKAFDTRNLSHETMLFMGGRPTEKLNDGWLFTVDPFDTGLRQHWYRDDSLDARQRQEPWDFQPDFGAPINLPASWNMQEERLRYYEGAVWYTRWFDHEPHRKGERLFLRIGAANYEAKIFLNGRFLGSHLGGSTPVFVELSEGLEDRNRLQLYVNNTRTLDHVPMRHFDWFNYGGIHRDVELVRLPRIFFRDAFIRLAPNEQGMILVDIHLSDQVSGTALLTIPALDIATEISVHDGIGGARIAAQPDLWSPGSPSLYDMEIRFGDDTVRDRIGFRTVAVDGTTVLLNGAPIFLRGICVHEDDAQLGRVRTEADIRRTLATARELGCNFLRLAHYPHHERVAQLADDAGIMLWEELPVYWAIAFDNPATYADAENQLLELIKRDRNRASVIVWSIGNENADTDARLAFKQNLAATARRHDPTRLISAACLINKTNFRLEDRLAETLDIVAINEYYGWYEPDMTGLEHTLAAYDIDKPLFISEVGADALAGHHGGEADLFTEDCQAAIYREQIRRLANFPALCGLSPWLLYDFRSDRRQNTFQQGWNRKGLIAADKTTRKAAFAVLQAFYKALTAPRDS